MFDLKDLKELPTPKEIEEFGQSSVEMDLSAPTQEGSGGTGDGASDKIEVKGTPAETPDNPGEREKT
jgi:hypothetical protein